ncbi:hypothetical protein FA13DRAFT_1166709 [Coprinellus micaceus]|uniref:F-box domain-containing protein n=1 Tax=Coprinellus micaceus TaxID=71717 RepID=A0A4Y7SU26_COPMI|nr:hypothetical protein FA13DRAFT_1166709 [Coprinellus micaceus]
MLNSEGEGPSPYLATEILELVIDELGAEAELLPTSSAAFQALLSFALTGHRVLTRCQRNLFNVLTLDSPEGKGRKTPTWAHLHQTIAMFQEKPQFASYVRRLKISLFHAFPTSRLAVPMTHDITSDSLLQNLREAEQIMLPQLLHKLPNVTSLSLDGRGSYIGEYSWQSIAPPVRQSVVEFLTRPVKGGNMLNELGLENLVMIPPSLLKDIPPSLHTLRLESAHFDWTSENDDKLTLLQPRQWRFAITSLDFGDQFELIDALLAYDSGRYLAKLQSLSCWIQRTLHAETLGKLLSVCAPSLRSLEISSFGR